VVPGVAPREDSEVAPVPLDLGVVARELVSFDPVPLEDGAEADEIPDVLELALDLVLLAPLIEARGVAADVKCHVVHLLSW
jgi:hypothetical protein